MNGIEIAARLYVEFLAKDPQLTKSDALAKAVEASQYFIQMHPQVLQQVTASSSWRR